MSIEGQGHFLTLAQGHLHLKIKTGFSQKPLGQSKPNFICKLSGTKKWKFIDTMVVTLPRWPPCPYIVKTLQKTFFSGTGGLISTKLGMSHRWLMPIIVCSNDDSRLTLTYFTARSNLVTKAYQYENVKTVDFSELLQPVTWNQLR